MTEPIYFLYNSRMRNGDGDLNDTFFQQIDICEDGLYGIYSSIEYLKSGIYDCYDAYEQDDIGDDRDCGSDYFGNEMNQIGAYLYGGAYYTIRLPYTSKILTVKHFPFVGNTDNLRYYSKIYLHEGIIYKKKQPNSKKINISNYSCYFYDIIFNRKSYTNARKIFS